MDHEQWVKARFDAYASFWGRVESLGYKSSYRSEDLRKSILAECQLLQTRLGRVDGLIMDNGTQSADHVP